MKDIMLKIVGLHVHDNVEEEQMELVTEGKMYEKGGVIYLTYDESEFTGMVGYKTRLRVDSNTVKMTRIGKDMGALTEMCFEKGERYTSLYDTPYGPVEMELLTNDLTSDLSYDGEGKVMIDYSISLKGLTEGRSKLNIEIV
ncbi:MAG: DUF1934 domain-containing protein [Anaerovoracaceae bacterium]